MAGVSRRNIRDKATSAGKSPNLDNTNTRTRKSAAGGHRGFTRIVTSTSSILLSIGIVLITIGFCMKNYFINPAKETVKPWVVTPVIRSKAHGSSYVSRGALGEFVLGNIQASCLFWNSCASLLAGLMWLGVKDGRYVMRHVCQDSDELATYGWTHHNGRDYGRQVLLTKIWC
ncbi:mannosyl-oligosaccharide glucosidase GCS1-like isoform X1 [Salvia splendens]|uniref:mannosyl-oligosaccharide glucosidase GCS1-like isoform X1 n=1 Tax=Salvia splendens TaxID=180675 RepID=UPI001C2531DE|nr:mannosyl-oligosaccharide glucosidase GCS1-like isoform X1 [Salvia splendens]